jgi:hypothetical protein
MAKQVRGRPRGERDDVSVKIDRTLKGRAELVAKHRGTTVAALLTELLGAPLDRAYLEMIRELERTKPAGGGK